jgi:hypothetical protein
MNSPRPGFVVAGLLALAAAAGACAGGPAPAPSTTHLAGSVAPRATAAFPPAGWIMSAAVLAELRAQDADHAVTDLLNHPTTFVTITKAGEIPSGWTVTPTQTFTSSAVLHDAVVQHQLLPGVQAVLLDIESWGLSPKQDKDDVVSAYMGAFTVAHAHGLQLVATPGVDLASAIAAQQHIPAWQAYLDDLRLPERIAPYADVFEVQSQSQEGTPSTFATLLSRGRAQAKGANPSVVFFGGVSTNPNGQEMTADGMLAAVRATGGEVTRYWLNDPRPSQACPKCTGPHAAMALAFLTGVLVKPL